MKCEGTITIDRLRVHAAIGVMDQERVVGNDFEVTLKVNTLLDSAALVDDDLEGTINYADLVAIIKEQMAAGGRLLEHVAWLIIEAVKSRYATTGGCVTITKLTPPIPCQVAGISITINW